MIMQNKMKLFLMLFVVLMAIINFISESEAACMGCPGKDGGSVLLCEGDTKFDAINKCGNPGFIEQEKKEITEKSRSKTDSDPSKSEKSGSSTKKIEIVETWYYNCGEGRFDKILTFVGSTLVSIRNGERGSGPEQCW